MTPKRVLRGPTIARLVFLASITFVPVAWAGAYDIPHDASVHGHMIDSIFRYITVATTICFVVMAAILIWSSLFHRQGKAKALYTHGDRKNNYLVTALVGGAVFFGIDMVVLVRSASELNQYFWKYPTAMAPDVVRVEVTAQQWAWNFRYPGADGKFNTPDDIVTLNDLRVPVDKPVHLKIRSKDVIHSFYLPNFRNKIDAIPGNITQLWFQGKEAGKYEIGCAQHCGVSHYKMRGELMVVTPDEFARWSKMAAADSARRYDAADIEAHDGWDWEKENG